MNRAVYHVETGWDHNGLQLRLNSAEVQAGTVVDISWTQDSAFSKTWYLTWRTNPIIPSESTGANDS